MLLRYDAAVRQAPYTDERGRWELLQHVLQPSDELLEVSLIVAEEQGAGLTAKTMAHKAESPRVKRLAA